MSNEPMKYFNKVRERMYYQEECDKYSQQFARDAWRSVFQICWYFKYSKHSYQNDK